MTRLAVISDSHGKEIWVRALAERLQRERPDAIIHLGDGQSDVKWLKKNVSIPVYGVCGNCDWLSDAPGELRLSFEGIRVLAVHGDRYDVKFDPSILSYYAEDAGAQLALFGHTHQPLAAYVGGVLMVNPGALKDGRYCVIEIRNGQIIPYLKEL